MTRKDQKRPRMNLFTPKSVISRENVPLKYEISKNHHVVKTEILQSEL